MNVEFPPLNVGLIEIFRSRFKQSLAAYPTTVCFGVFYKFWCDFWVCLGGDSFSQRIGKIRRNKECWRFNVVLKLEFEVKNKFDTQTVPYFTERLAQNSNPANIFNLFLVAVIRNDRQIWECDAVNVEA